MSIHPTAIIEEGAQLGQGCVVHAGAIITKHARLGDGVVVHPYAVIGGDPQDLRFDAATASYVDVGARTVIREHVTINRSTKAGCATVVGADCYLMACAHVAHDNCIGNRVVLANNVMLAGHVSVGDFVFIGGGVGIHQFCRIGESSMVGGLARVTLDIPPFVMMAERDDISGLNLIGLKRRGFSREVIAEIKECFREVYFAGSNAKLLAKEILETGVESPQARQFLEFFQGGKRGVARAKRVWTTGEEDGES